MKVTSSALRLRLEKLTTVTAAEREALSAFERESYVLKKHDLVIPADIGGKALAVLRSGWATRQITGPDEMTAISHVFGPGDLIGFGDLSFCAPPQNVIMQTDGSVGRLNNDALSQLTREHPRLWLIMTALAQVEDLILRDRFFAATRLRAEDRVMHFLLYIQSKVQSTGGKCGDCFPLPLNQRELGEALGLTDIYINRLLRSLSKKGEISVERPYVKITSPDRWIERVGFRDRYREADVTWLG